MTKLLLVVIVYGTLMPPGQTLAQESPSVEYQVKAAFLYNFVQFVSWPQEAFEGDDSPIVLGILGRDPFRGLLDQIVEGQEVAGRRLLVRRFDNLDQLEPTHLLFVPIQEADALAQVLRKIGRSPVLTVGESPNFLAGGGMIGFFIEENRVRFAINLEAAERAGLTVSSKLLKLARIYQRPR